MQKLTPGNLEHSVVIPCGIRNRIPASEAYCRAAGLRGMHYGWPGMTRTRDGHILVGASERHIHVDPFGREVVARSADNGRTWGEPEVIFDSLTDDRDLALNTLPDGTVVATWFSSTAWAYQFPKPDWKPILERVNPDTLRALARGWLRRSADGGRTWEDRIFPTLVGQHAGPTPLANGDLIYLGPYHDEQNGKKVEAATLSSDGGRTWRVVGEVPGPFAADPKTGCPATVLNENHVIETAPGHLLAAFRVSGEPDVRTVHFSRSDDGGRTWSVPENSGVEGFPPYLLNLQCGAILCVFADRRAPRTIRCMFSYDRGRTWDAGAVHTLRQFEFMADMGYPVAIETAPGEIFCVYYAIPKCAEPGYEALDMNQWGILATRFKAHQ